MRIQTLETGARVSARVPEASKIPQGSPKDSTDSSLPEHALA